MTTPKQPTGGDFDADAYAKKVDDLEAFRKEFSGKEFDKKVLASIQDSTQIQDEFRKIAWRTIREKIIWVIIGAGGIILLDVLSRVIPDLIKLATGNG